VQFSLGPKQRQDFLLGVFSFEAVMAEAVRAFLPVIFHGQGLKISVYFPYTTNGPSGQLCTDYDRKNQTAIEDDGGAFLPLLGQAGKRLCFRVACGQWLNRELGISPPEFPPDFHFSYPASGEYHFSVKSFATDPELFVSVFWDRVKVKTVRDGAAFTAEISRAEFASHELSLLGHLMVGYQPPAMADVTLFSFPTLGFNVLSGDFNRKGNGSAIPEAEVTADDLVVDVASLEGHSVNVLCCIRAVSQQGITAPDGAALAVKIRKVSETHVLEIACMTAFIPGI
jgi:hypothetical protein